MSSTEYERIQQAIRRQMSSTERERIQQAIQQRKSTRRLRVLLASTSAPPAWLLDKLVRQLLDLDLDLVAVCDKSQIQSSSVLVKTIARGNLRFDTTSDVRGADSIAGSGTPTAQQVGRARAEAAQLAGWAELLVLAPIDANGLAKMLHGVTDSLLLEVLRSWDVSKKILLVPGMSGAMWENPMTRKQLSKIRRKWKWIAVFPPLLWSYERKEKAADGALEAAEPAGRINGEWEGMEELMGAVKHQLDLATIGQDVKPGKMDYVPERSGARPTPPLPPEIWSMILEYTGDWELAQALRVHTTLATPSEWQAHVNSPSMDNEPFHRRLEWALLHGDVSHARHIISTTSPLPKYLSKLSIQLIMRWALVPVLTHLESAHKELFWSAFGHSFIPNKASSIFGRVELLNYWHTSPSFLTKEYTAEAMDGASANGFVHVLDWWRRSGLSLKYTEAALEQASGNGRLGVLDWWRRASKHSPERALDSETRGSDGSASAATAVNPAERVLALKPGKSVCHATQSGQLTVLRWWARSAIPFSHEDTVCKLASAHGHVHLLDFWLSHRGASKLLFDAQVLVAPTKRGHADVLEWWKEQARKGLRVEYKTCDIEEALEDGGGRGAEEVRRWWARNGLNLGVGTSEWMRTKVLG